MSLVGHPKVTATAYAQDHEARRRANQFAEAAVHNGLGRDAAMLPSGTLLRLKAQIERDFLVATMESSHDRF